MKKLFLSILTCIYMTVSSGIAMDIHYCMGKKSGVDFYKSKSDKCGLCGMKEKKGGCCSDEHSFYKLADAHKNASVHYDLCITECTILYNLSSPQVTTLPQVVNADHINSPPDTGIPLYISNRVFRI